MIGSVIDAGLRIHAFCLDCGHDEDVDLDEVARRLGRMHSSLPVQLVPRLVCRNLRQQERRHGAGAR
jgi:hypothetical protein